jgi:hypothetical protein
VSFYEVPASTRSWWTRTLRAFSEETQARILCQGVSIGVKEHSFRVVQVHRGYVLAPDALYVFTMSTPEDDRRRRARAHPGAPRRRFPWEAFPEVTIHIDRLGLA